jgi:hypothetical protein
MNDIETADFHLFNLPLPPKKTIMRQQLMTQHETPFQLHCTNYVVVYTRILTRRF